MNETICFIDYDLYDLKAFYKVKNHFLFTVHEGWQIYQLFQIAVLALT